jgi:hypothetical protein
MPETLGADRKTHSLEARRPRDGNAFRENVSSKKLARIMADTFNQHTPKLLVRPVGVGRQGGLGSEKSCAKNSWAQTDGAPAS